MKKVFNRISCFSFPVLFLFLFYGCVKDKVTRTYQVSTPIYETLSTFRESIKSVSALPVGTAGKISVLGKYIFLSEPYKGIHIIDNSAPASPKNISFINIPGNVDMAIKGNTLYADAFGDLVTFDITNPENVVAKNFTANVFPDHSIYYLGYAYDSSIIINPDSVQVIVGWSTRDTTVDYNAGINYPMYMDDCFNCAAIATNMSYAASAPAGNPVATNGSTARFSIVHNFLYTVGSSNLIAFDISEPNTPAFASTVQVGWGVETIYPFRDKLFIGTNSGMFMYDVQNTPASPTLAGQFSHVRACDPVISDGNYAYVTLRDGTQCQGFLNELEIVDISNMQNATLLKIYALTHPVGLSKDGDNLFICDGKGGLKIYDASDVYNLKLIKVFSETEAVDVVAANGRAIVVAVDGLYQYDYSQPGNIRFISKL